MKKQNAGFTLLELLITLVIIGILASIAYPSYIDNVRKTKRSYAQSGLMELASFLERRFTENNSYLVPNGADDPITGTTCATSGGCEPSINNGVSHDNYDYSLDAVASSSYTLQAEPKDGDDQENDTCATMTLTNTSAKTPTTDDCWL